MGVNPSQAKTLHCIGETDLSRFQNSRWDRYLGMTAAMTQEPVPVTTPPVPVTTSDHKNFMW